MAEGHRRGQIGMGAALQGEAVYSLFYLETALIKPAEQQRLYLALEIEKHLNTSIIKSTFLNFSEAI